MTEIKDTPVRLDFPFVGIPSFLRSQICTDLDQLDADIAVFGIPHDEGITFFDGFQDGATLHTRTFLAFWSRGQYL